MKILANQRGVALMMVLTSITILSLLMYTFRFDTSINKIKSNNIIARTQARLNAEAGLKMSLLRLEIYQQVKTEVQKNKNLQQVASTEMLNMIWSMPLVFPLPVMPFMSLKERSDIEEFQRVSLLRGEIQGTIESLSSKININLLRISSFDLLKNPSALQEQDRSRSQNPSEKGSTTQELEKRLIELIITAINAKQETDELFFQKYSAIRAEELTAVIKFYISDENADIGVFRNQIDADFDRAGIRPKHAPMTSISEMYLLPGWNEDLVNLIKNEITVHGTPMIDVNELSPNLLRILMPGLTLQQIEEFYEYKSNPMNPEMPITFNNIDEVKRYFTQEARIISPNAFDEQVNRLQSAGIKFGANPVHFKVTSKGVFQNTEYTLQAIVSMEAPDQKSPRQGAQEGSAAGDQDGQDGQKRQDGQQTRQGQGSRANQNTQLSKPYILELLVI